MSRHRTSSRYIKTVPATEEGQQEFFKIRKRVHPKKVVKVYRSSGNYTKYTHCLKKEATTIDIYYYK